MKIKIHKLMAFLLLSATVAAYANDCGKLKVSIFNKSGQTCELRKANILNGEIVEGEIPKVIESGQLTPAFTMVQGYTTGPSIRLEYKCENKTVAFTSGQGLCSVYAGDIYGNANSSNNITANYTVSLGSWWSSLPGEIKWTLN